MMPYRLTRPGWRRQHSADFTPATVGAVMEKARSRWDPSRRTPPDALVARRSNTGAEAAYGPASLTASSDRGGSRKRIARPVGIRKRLAIRASSGQIVGGHRRSTKNSPDSASTGQTRLIRVNERAARPQQDRPARPRRRQRPGSAAERPTPTPLARWILLGGRFKPEWLVECCR